MNPAADEWALLRRVYPAVRWNQVEFVEGLPWPWRLRRTVAFVLPLPRGRTRVHLRPGLSAERRARVLLHEGWHVLQRQEMGALRFALRYLLLAVGRGFGPAHPMEAPAYALAAEAEPSPVLTSGMRRARRRP